MCAGATYWVGVRKVVWSSSERLLSAIVDNAFAKPEKQMPKDCIEIFCERANSGLEEGGGGLNLPVSISLSRAGEPVALSGPHLQEISGLVHLPYW